MERPAKQGVRMADHGCVRRVLCTFVEQSFEAASGTFKEKGAD